jgi:glycosyltransferase involved in cell wall biosynthesis
MAPTVSVIIPNYNHAPFLHQRIETVLNQTYRDFEVILLDDCSTDNSHSIISGYGADPRVQIEFNDKNSGSTFKQWKKGIALARGEYIWIAESDDYSDGRFLERLVPILEQEPDVTFVYCRSWMINQDGDRNGFADHYLAEIDLQRWTADFRADGQQACRDHFVHANSVPNASSVLFRKSVYERVGGVDESLLVSGDWKLWVLLALEGQIAYVGEPLNYYREHLGNVRTKIYETGRGAGEHLGMVRWMIGRVTPTKAILEKAYFVAAFSWIPAVLSRRVPLRHRWTLLREAIATDPHALRRLVRPVLVAARMKLALEFRLLRERFENRVP